MKYEEYKIEDLTFLKNETDKWSIFEKKEFLDTCPESKMLPTIIEQLKQIKTAIENDEIKVNRYGEINKNSMKAYIKNNGLYAISYGRPSRSYFYGSDTKDFYFNIDGSYEKIYYGSQVESFIEKYEDESNIDHRFSMIAGDYAVRERNFAKEIETESYKAINSDRILANQKLHSALSNLKLYVPVSVNKASEWSDCLDVETKRLDPSDYYSKNNYGEILVNNAPMTEKEATELLDKIFEMSAKISVIIDEYKDEIAAVLQRK